MTAAAPSRRLVTAPCSTRFDPLLHQGTWEIRLHPRQPRAPPLSQSAVPPRPVVTSGRLFPLGRTPGFSPRSRPTTDHRGTARPEGNPALCRLVHAGTPGCSPQGRRTVSLRSPGENPECSDRFRPAPTPGAPQIPAQRGKGASNRPPLRHRQANRIISAPGGRIQDQTVGPSKNIRNRGLGAGDWGLGVGGLGITLVPTLRVGTHRRDAPRRSHTLVPTLRVGTRRPDALRR
jgi:hypothetical protein